MISELDAMTALLSKPSRLASSKNAFEAIRDALLSYPKDMVWLVATGPLTNMALLFSIYPELASHVKGLSIMGGAIGGFGPISLGDDVNSDGRYQPRCGNRTPFAEFNMFCDPESAQCVFRNSLLASKTMLIPLDLTLQACIDDATQHTLLIGHRDTTQLRSVFNKLLHFYAYSYPGGPPLHDPIAVAVLLADGMLHESQASSAEMMERWTIKLILDGHERGRTQIQAATEGVTIPRTLHSIQFWQTVVECMDYADESTGYQEIDSSSVAYE